jgi:hypothetical protein
MKQRAADSRDGVRPDSPAAAGNSRNTSTIWVRNLAGENGAFAACSPRPIGGMIGLDRRELEGVVIQRIEYLKEILRVKIIIGDV